MGVLWLLPTWPWAVVGAVALVACLVILRTLARVFAALAELRDSVEISKRLLTSSLESTRDEAERAQEGLGRLRRSKPGEAGLDAAGDEPDIYKDW